MGKCLDKPTRERASLLFAALGHPTRLRIVELLCEEEKSVGDIAATLNLLQSSTSQHLTILLRAGILAIEPRGNARFYRVRGPRIGLILNTIAEFCSIHNLLETETESCADDI